MPTWKLCLIVALVFAAASATLVLALTVCLCRRRNKDTPVEWVQTGKVVSYPNPWPTSRTRSTMPPDDPMSINPTMVRSANSTPVNRAVLFPVSPPTATTSPSPSHAPRRIPSPPSHARSSHPLPTSTSPLAHQGGGRKRVVEKAAAVVKDPLACYSPAISVLLEELDYERLETATNGLGRNSKLAWFGGPWQVVFKDRDTQLVEDQGLPAKVVIKRYDRIFSEKECKRIRGELKQMFTLRHKHLVSLLRYSLGNGRLYMVYERMSKGSLEKHLFPKPGVASSLDWTARHRIVKEVAQGLDVLHVSNQPHGSIKLSTIMLDHYYTAHIDGHFKYRPDMRAAESDAASMEADIAADIADLGAMILELVCGRRRNDVASFLGSAALPLVDWVWAIYGEAFGSEEPHRKRDEIKENRIFDAVDRTLEGEINRSQASTLLILGLACSHPDPKLRPQIRDVREVLLELKPVPQLPFSKPTCT